MLRKFFLALHLLTLLQFSLATTGAPDAVDKPDSSPFILAVTGEPSSSGECLDVKQYRTVQDILYMCLTTISLCIWVAIHADVPHPRNRSWFVSFALRIAYAAVSTFVPQFLSALAWQERGDATRYMEMWNKRFAPQPVARCSGGQIIDDDDDDDKTLSGPFTKKTWSKGFSRDSELEKQDYQKKSIGWWTRSHGFLLDMGGLELYKNGRFWRRVRPGLDKADDKDCFYLFHAHPVHDRRILRQIRLISQEDIRDKSKSDFFFKAYVVLQTSWFLIKCIVRWATHLPLTQLEIVTLAYAVQTVLIVALWWEKPHNVTKAFPIYVKSDYEPFDSLSPEAREKVLQKSTPEEAPSGDEDNDSEHSPLDAQQGQRTSEKVRKDFFLVVAGALGMVFGGIHLIPIWMPMFPSVVESIMWEVCAAIITGTSFLLGVLCLSVVDKAKWLEVAKRMRRLLLRDTRRRLLSDGLLSFLRFNKRRRTRGDSLDPLNDAETESETEPPSLGVKFLGFLLTLVTLVFAPALIVFAFVTLGAAAVILLGATVVSILLTRSRNLHVLAVGLSIGLLLLVYTPARLILIVLPFTTMRQLPNDALMDIAWKAIFSLDH